MLQVLTKTGPMSSVSAPMTRELAITTLGGAALDETLKALPESWEGLFRVLHELKEGSKLEVLEERAETASFRDGRFSTALLFMMRLRLFSYICMGIGPQNYFRQEGSSMVPTPLWPPDLVKIVSLLVEKLNASIAAAAVDPFDDGEFKKKVPDLFRTYVRSEVTFREFMSQWVENASEAYAHLVQYCGTSYKAKKEYLRGALSTKSAKQMAEYVAQERVIENPPEIQPAMDIFPAVRQFV